MFHNDENSLESRLQELLANQADALIAGTEKFQPDFERYRFNSQQEAEARDLLQLASQLREALAPVSPSMEFATRLKGELTGQAPVTLLVRWRKLPASYQLAAKLGGLTLTAGIVLLAARRGINVVSALNNHNPSKAEPGLSLNTAS